MRRPEPRAGLDLERSQVRALPEKLFLKSSLGGPLLCPGVGAQLLALICCLGPRHWGEAPGDPAGDPRDRVICSAPPVASGSKLPGDCGV